MNNFEMLASVKTGIRFNELATLEGWQIDDTGIWRDSLQHPVCKDDLTTLRQSAKVDVEIDLKLCRNKMEKIEFDNFGFILGRWPAEILQEIMALDDQYDLIASEDTELMQNYSDQILNKTNLLWCLYTIFKAGKYFSPPLESAVPILYPLILVKHLGKTGNMPFPKI